MLSGATPFSAIVAGSMSGFFGAALAHVLTTFADRLGAENWLRGPYGPQFVPIALYTGIFYSAIGAAAGRKPKIALLGFFGPFLGIALPMLALTRYSGWGMPRELPATPQWQIVVILIYTLSIWGTIAALGATCASSRWRGALAAVLGSIAGFVILKSFLWAVPSYAQARWSPVSLLPSPLNLMDGLLSGAGLCLALSLNEKIRRNA
jgi:hypothetical protein